MTYSEALDELFRLRAFGWKLGLETMEALAARLGHPERQLPFLHVAGTNGKGSVAAMCAAILDAAGYRVGLYTSPHLVSFCERFQVNGQPIAEADVVRLVERLRPALAARPGQRAATFFEVATALALLYFTEQRVEMVVWETGLGGRLDATNIVVPRVSVITPIGLDHTQHLGDSLAAIAAEKCGIIKPAVPVVTAPQDPAVLAVIREQAATRGCRLTVVDQPWQGALALRGEHQRWNAATACAALEAAGLGIPADKLAEGLRRARWPARFQVIGDGPPLVIDGAHNPSAIEALIDTLQREFPGRPVTLVLGILGDKDGPAVCARLAAIASRVQAVAVRNDRTRDPLELAALCRAARPGLAVEVADSLATALEQARRQTPAHGVILVTGSLFLAGEALAQLTSPAAASSRELILQ